MTTCFHELEFGSDEVVDPLLDRVAGHQLEDLDELLLADAVDAVGGLILLGRVPPPVVVDDHRRAGEIDADTAGEQAREQHPFVLFRVEAADDPTAVAGRAGEL